MYSQGHIPLSGDPRLQGAIGCAGSGCPLAFTAQQILVVHPLCPYVFFVRAWQRDHRAGVDVLGMSFFLLDQSSLLRGRGNGPVGDELPNYHPLVSPGKSELVLKEMLAFCFYNVGGRGIIK